MALPPVAKGSGLCRISTMEKDERPHENCNSCPLRREGHLPIASKEGAGTPPATWQTPTSGGSTEGKQKTDKLNSVLLVRAFPHPDDVRTGKLTSGDSRIVAKALSRAGLENSTDPSISTTFVVRCSTPGLRPPTPEEVLACRPIIQQELTRLNPTVIVPMGPLATHSLTGLLKPVKQKGAHRQTGLLGWRGYVAEPCVTADGSTKNDDSGSSTDGLSTGGSASAHQSTPSHGLQTSGLIRHVSSTVNLGRVRGVVGKYKTSRKGKYTKGDDKYGNVDLVVGGLYLGDGCRGVIPTLDPVAVRLGGFKDMPAMVADLHKAGLLQSGCEVAPIPTEVAFSSAEMVRRGWFGSTVPRGSEAIVAFDIETTQLEPEAGSIFRISFSWAPGQGVSIPWNAAARQFTQAVLGDPERRVVGHNVAGFDVPHLAANGVEVQAQVYDTLIMAQMLDPDLPKSLNFVTSLYVLMHRWKDLNHDEEEWYSLLDSERVQWLFPRMVEAMQREHMWEHFDLVIRPALRTLSEFTYKGVPVDAEVLRRWQSRLASQLTRLGRAWWTMHATVELSSPSQVARLLRDVYKVDTDNADKHVINKLCQPSAKWPRGLPAARLIKRYRKVADAISRYANDRYYREDRHGQLRMYPSYVPVGKDTDGESRVLTATGRRAAKSPPVQQFPKTARAIVVAEPGQVFFEADYSQIEAWLTAIECRDERMMELLYSGTKIHEWALDELRKVDPRMTYKGAKRVVHGTNYLMGWMTLQRSLHDDDIYVDAATVKGFIAMMRSILPGRTRWQRQVIEQAKIQGFVANAFGRRRKFFVNSKGELEEGPAAVAFTPASNMADIMWHNLRDVPAILAKYGGRLLGDNHDSIYGCVPVRGGGLALREMVEAMERPWPEVTGPEWPWWCPVDLGIGPNWRDVEDVDPAELADDLST